MARESTRAGYEPENLRIRHQAPRRSAPDHWRGHLHRRLVAARHALRRACFAARTPMPRIGNDRRRRAKSAPGVVAVYHRRRHRRAQAGAVRLALAQLRTSRCRYTRAIANDTVRYVGDIVAVVVAETALVRRTMRSSSSTWTTTPLASGRPMRPRQLSGRAAAACRDRRTTRHSTGRSPAATSTRRSRTPTSSSRNGSSSSGSSRTRWSRAPRSRSASGASGELTLWNTTQNPHILRFLCSVVDRSARRQAPRHRARGRRRVRQQDRRVSARTF